MKQTMLKLDGEWELLIADPNHINADLRNDCEITNKSLSRERELPFSFVRSKDILFFFFKARIKAKTIDSNLR